MKTFRVLLVLYFLGIAVGPLVQTARAEEEIMLFQSVEDPAFPPDANVCSRAPFVQPFPANVLLGASLWSVQTRASDGVVVNTGGSQIGSATACAWITGLYPGASASFYVELKLGQTIYPASGKCSVMSDSIPVYPLFLVGCSLTVPGDSSNGLLVGIVTSNSVFNAAHLPGYQTGSFWTLHLYR